VPELSVAWRDWGHRLTSGDDLLQFEVADRNQVILRSAAVSGLYRGIQDAQGHPAGSQVLPLSCFAITSLWTPSYLAEGTRFRSYRTVRAATLWAAEFDVWPTATFTDAVPDPRNEVHYDLIVAAGHNVVPFYELRSTSKPVRQAARERLRPLFEKVWALLGDEQPLDRPTKGLQ
jgi:hypothetical protein